MSSSNHQIPPKGTPPKSDFMNRGPMGAGMGAPVDKAKNFKETLNKLIEYLKPERKRFVLVVLMGIASTIFSIVGPKIMGKATTKLGEGLVAKYTYIFKLQNAISRNMPIEYINKLRHQTVPGFDFEYIGNLMIILIILYIISALFNFVMSYIMAGVSQNTVYKMRNDVKQKLDRLPLKYFDERPHGEILSRVTNDMDNISTTLQQSLTQLITSVISVVGILGMMISISPTMTLIAMVTLPLSGIITAIIAKKSQKYFGKQQESIGALNGHVEEMFTGHKIVKVFGHEDDSIKKFKEINEELYRVGWKAQFLSGIIFPALNFVNNVGYVLICVVGGLLVAKNSIKIGDIQAFIQYMRQFTQPIVQLANIANIIQGTIASAERVFEILGEDEQIPEIIDSQKIISPKGDVSFSHVKFSYSDDVLIEDLSIDIRQGQMVAIVGPTGAGKTTLVNLLMRFYEIKGGTIAVDGIDVTLMKRGDLRTLFGMVLQDTWLFNGTLMDNIAYGRKNATQEDIIRASKAAHADHFIRTLPDGYNTIINEEANNISSGQKQLITIARAILADPAILILDEATSNVDTRTEVLIQKAMTNLMKGRTSFVIAHRLSTIRDADMIIVMNKGTIIENGTHIELLAAGGFYAELYNSQFASDENDKN